MAVLLFLGSGGRCPPPPFGDFNARAGKAESRLSARSALGGRHWRPTPLCNSPPLRGSEFTAHSRRGPEGPLGRRRALSADVFCFPSCDGMRIPAALGRLRFNIGPRLWVQARPFSSLFSVGLFPRPGHADVFQPHGVGAVVLGGEVAVGGEGEILLGL